MSTDNHVNESILNSDIKEWQKKNRIDHMAYLPGMEQIDPAVREQVIAAMEAYDPMAYTARDVRAALEDKGYEFISADVAMVPSTYTALSDPDDLKKMGILLDHLEDDDDVQNVWHNLENEEDLDR